MQEYETRMKAEGGLSVLPTNLSDLIPAMTGSMVARMRSQRLTETEVDLNHINNTAQLVSKLALHTAWDVAPSSEH